MPGYKSTIITNQTVDQIILTVSGRNLSDFPFILNFSWSLETHRMGIFLDIRWLVTVQKLWKSIFAEYVLLGKNLCIIYHFKDLKCKFLWKHFMAKSKKIRYGVLKSLKSWFRGIHGPRSGWLMSHLNWHSVWFIISPPCLVCCPTGIFLWTGSTFWSTSFFSISRKSV